MNEEENDKAIAQKNEELLRKKFYFNLGWYFSKDTNLKGGLIIVGDKIDSLASQVKTLNENLVKADSSSTKLTTSLNKLTKWGVIVAGCGVLVAACGVVVTFLGLTFEVIKYFGTILN